MWELVVGTDRACFYKRAPTAHICPPFDRIPTLNAIVSSKRHEVLLFLLFLTPLLTLSAAYRLAQKKWVFHPMLHFDRFVTGLSLPLPSQLFHFDYWPWSTFTGLRTDQFWPRWLTKQHNSKTWRNFPWILFFLACWVPRGLCNSMWISRRYIQPDKKLSLVHQQIEIPDEICKDVRITVFQSL